MPEPRVNLVVISIICDASSATVNIDIIKRRSQTSIHTHQSSTNGMVVIVRDSKG